MMNLKKMRIGITAEIIFMIVLSIFLFAGITFYISYSIFTDTIEYQIGLYT